MEEGGMVPERWREREEWSWVTTERGNRERTNNRVETS